MALPDAVQGGKRPSPLITWTEEDENGAPVDLTDATITARIVNITSGAERASDGTFTVTNAAGGVFRWDYGDNDVATAGKFEVQFSAAFATGPSPALNYAAPWRVRKAI